MRRVKTQEGKMNKKMLGLLLVVPALTFLLLACDVMSFVPGLGGAGGVGGSSSQQAMWPDVPAFEGATQDPKDALGTSLFNNAQSGQASGMRTLIFKTSKTPPDVAAFYTVDRMKQNGWSVSESSFSDTGCSQDHYEGQPRTICAFSKKSPEGRELELSIDARPDPANSGATRLIFVYTTGSLVTP
jgi:hypothetical protein